MRPDFETPANRDAEAKVARYVAKLWGKTAQPMARRYAVDYALMSGENITDWLEIKCRTNAMAAYADYSVSLAKVQGLLDIARISAIPAHLIVRWSDALGFLTMPATFDVRMGGRKDRGDWQDTEPMAHFPLTSFGVMWPAGAS